MSTPETPSQIPLGDLRLYDSYRPTLTAGSWYLEARHAVLQGSTPVNPEKLAAVQEVVVSAPQLTIDSTAIVAVHPPDSSTGSYGNELPHVVITEPMLPWERALGGASTEVPWLALLLLDPDQVVDPADSATGAVNTTVGEFLAPSDGKTIKPTVTPAEDVATTDPMTTVTVPVAAFAEVAPRLDEVEFLTHCRQANATDKATLGVSEQGLFSVVVGNRFPAAPAKGVTTPLKSVVHLVSLEGLEPYLAAGADFGAAENVLLASLASWSFWTIAEPQEDFRGLAEGIVSEHGEGTPPDRYRLRLSSSTVSPAAPGGSEAIKRLDQGFVPLPYLARSAESTIAWYRGPFTPYPVAPIERPGPFLTADAALAYQAEYGLFDGSLAAAFQVGRAAALADPAFGQRLLDLRSRGHCFADALQYRLDNDAFSASEIAELSGATVQDELGAVLSADLLSDLGQKTAPPAPPAPPPPGPDSSPKEALAAFLASEEVQAALLDAVRTDLDPLATWLSRLLLLAPVPFHALVSAEPMLPVESVRFFSVDPNWLEALLDGALSIGVESSRDTFLQQIFGETLRSAAYEAVETYRSTLPGEGPPRPATGTAPISGMLLRSALLAGWPNLAVRARAGGKPLKTLRMDALSPNVLLCLFSGTPAEVSISEPQEGLRFGTDDDGNATLRSLIADNGIEVGQQFSGDPVVPVRDPSGKEALAMRAAGSRVLNISPKEGTGLVQRLQAGLIAPSPEPVGELGAADLALQMIRAPETVTFTTPPASPKPPPGGRR
ncbi:MAG TPA: hypothetical protein VFI03_02140 [Solirubrobacterales bacterium]|nr:hypothetical protein [Solirubrobacterales bacterium]